MRNDNNVTMSCRIISVFRVCRTLIMNVCISSNCKTHFWFYYYVAMQNCIHCLNICIYSLLDLFALLFQSMSIGKCRFFVLFLGIFQYSLWYIVIREWNTSITYSSTTLPTFQLIGSWKSHSKTPNIFYDSCGIITIFFLFTFKR